MSLLLKVLQLSLCSLVAGLAGPVLMFLLGRVVRRIMVPGRVVRRIMVPGWVVRRIMVPGRVVRRIMIPGRVVRRIMVLGRVVVRVTSGCDHGEGEEQGHQQRRHKAVLHQWRSLSPVISVLGERLLLCLLSLCLGRERRFIAEPTQPLLDACVISALIFFRLINQIY
jgi:hypothetical protein